MFAPCGACSQPFLALFHRWCTEQSENVLGQVTAAFLKLGMQEAPRLPRVESFPHELRQLQKVARDRGGVLVTKQYQGGKAAEWQCGNPDHPSWVAELWRVRKGAWCPSCAGNRRLTLDDLRSWGGSLGLELLDQEYPGSAQQPYTWQCQRAGHLTKRSRASILRSLSQGLEPCTQCCRARFQAGRDDAIVSAGNYAWPALHAGPKARPGERRRVALLVQNPAGARGSPAQKLPPLHKNSPH